MFDKLRGIFGNPTKTNEARQPSKMQPHEVQIRQGFSPQLQAVFDRTSDKAADSFKSVQSMIRDRLGPDYRTGLDIHASKIALAKAGSSKPELEFPILIAGTELGLNPDDHTFIWPWALPMLGLPPFPVWTEFANEIQQIGGGADGIEEFLTPVLKYPTANDLFLFYLAIQGWANLDVFFCPQIGQANIIVFAKMPPDKLQAD